VVVPKLLEFLSDADAQVRWRSARALGDYATHAAAGAPALRQLLTDDDPIVKYHAAVALGKIGDSSGDTIQALVGAATSSDGRVARAAIAALRSLHPDPQHVVAAMKKALASNDDAVVLYALEAVVERGAEAVPLLEEALKEPKTAYLACTAIERIGPDAAKTVPTLTALLGETSHSQLVIEALLALASIGPAAQSAASQILPLMETSTDSTIPVAAAYALGSIRATGADAALRQATTKGDNPFLQMIASWSLAVLHPQDEAQVKQAIDRLTRGLGSNDDTLRAAAANCLQRLDAPPELVAPALLGVANDPDPAVRDNVVSALVSLGPSIVPRAVKALSHAERRGLAVTVLTHLGPKASGAVDALVKALAGADPEFQAQVHLALAAIGPAAAPATSALIKALGSDDERVRHSAFFALRQIGPSALDARTALLKHLHADDVDNKFSAAWALSRIAPDDQEGIKLGIPVVLGGLTNADEEVRLECIEALAAWGPAAKKAVPALARVANEDNSPVVRESAKAARARIAG
jgi:HEAT repeat protein